MYAKVIVNHPSRAVDKLFDYELPDEFADVIKPGSRVIVPFSRGNNEREAYVLEIKNTTEASNVKSIIRPSSDEKAFKESMLPVISYLRTRYLCSYYDAIKVIIPSGTSMKSLEWVVLNSQKEELKTGTNEKRIISLLSDNGGGMDTYSIGTYFDKDIHAVLSRLEKKGIVSREYRHMREINKKRLRAARLSVDVDEAMSYCDRSRSIIQKQMLSILIDNEFLSTADLVRFSRGNYSALSTLVKNGLVEYFDLYIERALTDVDEKTDTPPALTAEQKAAVDAICSCIDKHDPQKMLLHGVTGSGKTEVFLHAIEHTVNSGKTALVLVPEISLTPQMVSRFSRRFGKRIAILHSGLSLGERYDQWHGIMNGDADIVIGARSAVFAPLENIGIIIIDEEHSDTYKSEMNPRYHAREVAMERAQQWGAVTLLASATPSAESYNMAMRGKYRLLEMNKRYNSSKMPEIDIVDMRTELENGNKSMFSKTMFEALRDNIDSGGQAILFMNRRGFSTFVSCRRCGFVPMCNNCNISLTYHSYDNSLKCHYCGYKQKNYDVCPACGSKYIRYFGGGTQRVEDEVKRLFPDATTIRLDADATTKKNSHKLILEQFEKEKIDIMIGTQMVSKGLDFENVTLVGVMSADTMLHLNDFRSGERTFDMLEQVSGRAGRGNKPGRAVIQTYDPDNYAIKLVKTHDYKAFYRMTDAERRAMWYPPYSEMVCIRFTAEDNELTRRASFRFRECLGDINEFTQKIAILGPIPSGISRIKNRYRWQIIIKTENSDLLNELLIMSDKKVYGEYASVQVSIDKNPMTIY